MSAAEVSLQFTPTQDWFSHNNDAWTRLFPLVESKCPRVLEIGSWEGRSAVFLLKNLCVEGGEIVCIDHFDLFETNAGKERYARMHHNLTTTGKRFRIMKEFSFPAIMKLLEEEMDKPDPGFDWIYIDGSHEADDTFLDGELAWRLARQGAIFIFDDYHWDKEPENSIHHPKRGIDAFLELHRGQYERLPQEDDYQVVLRKTSDMRIGFLTPEKSHASTVNDGFGYGINVAFTVDTTYAMPVAVAIRSILEHTSESVRITFYIVDYGLSEEDKGKIKHSVPLHDDSTLMFVMPKEGLGTSMGVTWAKLELHRTAPVERILYLDADVLVRGDLKVLWEADLEGKPVGAVVDVGYPMGHSGIERGPYFNAGVLLMDLAAVRSSAQAIEELAQVHSGSRYRDQDALNIHFKGNWVSLPLSWNAQGLGTYATYPSPERAELDLTKMYNPNIVHFTGPVNPTVGEVLDPHIQPPTAKPWGYIGAPGHPYQQEWWETLERTEWRCGDIGKLSFSSPWFEARRSGERKKVASDGPEKFHRVADSFVDQLRSLLLSSVN